MLKNRDPLLIDVPESFETERLRCRLLVPGEGAMVAEAIVASLPELRPWMPWAQSPSADDNVRSAAVADRQGFALEGVLRRRARDVRGELYDMRVYARLSAEGL